MKSLKDKSKYKHNFDNPEIFTDDILKFIANEGFMFTSNDSYCSDERDRNGYKIHRNCYYKHLSELNFPTNVYIFEHGIGVDVDYDCGGNLRNIFWKFEQYGNSFEKCYDLMVDYVNG